MVVTCVRRQSFLLHEMYHVFVDFNGALEILVLNMLNDTHAKLIDLISRGIRLYSRIPVAQYPNARVVQKGVLEYLNSVRRFKKRVCR